MITTGSKYFFGIAALAFVAAVVYGGATAGHEINMATLLGVISLGWKGSVGDHLGYSVLIGLFACSVFLGCVSVAFRDADAHAQAQVVHADAIPDAAVPQSIAYAPLIGAFGAAVLAVGIVTGVPLVVFGVGLMAVATFEWAARVWSERATGDPEVNRAIRDRIMYPIEFPILAAVGIAVFVLAISRVLVALPKAGAYLIFGGVPALILLAGVLIARRDHINRNVIATIAIVAGLIVLIGGVVGAAVGPVHVSEEHEKKSGEGSLRVTHPGDPVVIRRTTS
jgi:hypothetical protein